VRESCDELEEQAPLLRQKAVEEIECETEKA
jgi:hypothetical protein